MEIWTGLLKGEYLVIAYYTYHAYYWQKKEFDILQIENYVIVIQIENNVILIQIENSVEYYCSNI